MGCRLGLCGFGLVSSWSITGLDALMLVAQQPVAARHECAVSAGAQPPGHMPASPSQTDLCVRL